MGTEKKETLEAVVRKNLNRDASGRRDLCTIYRNKEELDALVDYLAEPYQGKVDYVLAPEPLGFILGGMLADRLKVGFIPIRNGNVAILDENDRIRALYIDHSDRSRSLQIRKSNLPEGSRVLLADDWIETAATMQACLTIIEEAECSIAGIVSFGAEKNPATGEMIENGQIRSVLVR